MSGTPDIFLSYNREDAEVARRFAEGFEAQGFGVWWDQALRSGEAYDKVTEAALRGAKAVVVLWSPRSVDSRWVRAEASIADENGTLVPVRIEPCDLPVMFRLTQTAELSGWQGAADDKSWLTFLGDVRRMLGQEAEPLAQPAPAPGPAGSGIPIIAVLPITCRGGGEEMEFLAEDLTEEITLELARNGIFEVIAASTMATWRGKIIDNRALGQELDARYLIEGRLRRSGDSVRVDVQIIDAVASKMIESQRFARKADEIDASLEQFAAAIGVGLGEQLRRIEANRVMANPGPYSGWEHTIRSWAYSRRLASDSLRLGIEEARQAVAKAPDLGRAHAALAARLSLPVVTGGEELEEALGREIRTHAARAIELDGDNLFVINMLVNAYAALGDEDAALRLAMRAAELNPNDPQSYLLLGFAHMLVGNIADAIAAYEHEDRLTFLDVSRYQWLSNIGRCYLLEGRLAEAEEALDQSLAIHPDYDNSLKWKAIAAALLGKEETALTTVRRLREVEPDKSIDQHVRQMMFYKGLRDRLAEPVATLRRLWDATENESS